MRIDYHYTVTTANLSERPRGFFDAAGVLLSQLCLLHCFLLPAVLAVLPSLDFHSLPGGAALHFGILLLSTPTAIYALLSGRRYHRLARPLIYGVSGLALLWFATTLEYSHAHILSHAWGHRVGALGSLLLFAAHVSNWRAVRRTSCGCVH